jgi:hypothetical protein
MKTGTSVMVNDHRVDGQTAEAVLLDLIENLLEPFLSSPL